MTRYIALAAVAVLAACSDSATAPATNVRPIDGASSLIVKPIFLATLTVRIADKYGATIIDNTGTVKFSKSPTDTFTVKDNSPQDGDPASGKLKVTMVKAASYTACFVNAMTYAPDATTGFNPCTTVSSSASSVDLGTVYVMRKPMIIATVQNQLGALIGGATMRFSDLTTGATFVATDDDAVDQWNNATGYVLHIFDVPGSFAVCEVAPPPGTTLLTQKCFKKQLGWEDMYWPIFTHYQKL